MSFTDDPPRSELQYSNREVLLAFTARSTFGRGSSWWIRTRLRRCGERMLIERRHIHLSIKIGIDISYAFNNFIYSSSYTRSTYYTTCWFGDSTCVWLLCFIWYYRTAAPLMKTRAETASTFLWQFQWQSSFWKTLDWWKYFAHYRLLRRTIRGGTAQLSYSYIHVYLYTRIYIRTWIRIHPYNRHNKVPVVHIISTCS